MGDRALSTYDIVGVGFGPSNLALAITLEELPGLTGGPALSSAFFERRPSLNWHRDMLLPSAKMQVSFLKDLATFRNPASRFSFVSYLYDVGRLPDFVDNQDFFPTRQEFHSYLEWAHARCAADVTYGSEVTVIRPSAQGRPGEPIDHLTVDVREDGSGRARTVLARNVVLSTGLVPRMPSGIKRDRYIWHSSEFLSAFRAWQPSDLKRVAVVGAGQSAAELVRFLHASLPAAEVYAIVPSYGYAIADDTPFANRVFNPSAVDDYFHGSQRSKDAIWRYHGNTNYAVVDSDVIRELHRVMYEEQVRGEERLHLVNLARVDGAKRVDGTTRVIVHSLATEESRELDVDVLVCATGYDPMDPSDLLGGLSEYCLRDELGRPRVERDYRLVTRPELRCGIYLQGGTEHTHGLSSSLLSNIAVRSGEIADSVAARLHTTVPGNR